LEVARVEFHPLTIPLATPPPGGLDPAPRSNPTGKSTLWKSLYNRIRHEKKTEISLKIRGPITDRLN
jgi:hypothetical protein